MTPVWIALAGSFGAMSRFVLDGHIKAKYNYTFPWATFIINTTGSFVLGLVSGILLKHHNLTDIMTIIGVGFCGEYTTFSTASFETVRLLERRDLKRALGNAVGGLLATVAVAILGIIIGQGI
ncbi:camphor resistance CrcB protein 2 [candidate division TM7 genomosp. GTL1]|nr:camphor resistance CrcB protein 2 [candidate division TM7 genomosp. GTL1]